VEAVSIAETRQKAVVEEEPEFAARLRPSQIDVKSMLSIFLRRTHCR
jgi:hypothetical protein